MDDPGWGLHGRVLTDCDLTRTLSYDKPKRNKLKRNKPKRNKPKRNKPKRNKLKRNKVDH